MRTHWEDWNSNKYICKSTRMTNILRKQKMVRKWKNPVSVYFMWVCGGLIVMWVIIDKAFYSRDIRRELPTYTEGLSCVVRWWTLYPITQRVSSQIETIFSLVCAKKDFLGEKCRVGFRRGLIGNKDGGCACVCAGKNFFGEKM